jgi:hypothetical protein
MGSLLQAHMQRTWGNARAVVVVVVVVVVVGGVIRKMG